MQASLQPRQSADDYELGMRIAGRDGKLWEVVMDQEEEWRHRWSAVRKAGQGKGGLGGTKRRRCGECSGCLAENCGTCGNCLDMPKFGGPGTRRQTCERRVCLYKHHEDEGEKFRRQAPRDVRVRVSSP